MSAIAVAGAILLGVTCAYVTRGCGFAERGIIDIAMMLPWALPGTVVAFNLIIAFARPSVFSFGQVLIGTYRIVPLAYFVRFSPLDFSIDGFLTDAARSVPRRSSADSGLHWWELFVESCCR